MTVNIIQNINIPIIPLTSVDSVVIRDTSPRMFRTTAITPVAIIISTFNMITNIFILSFSVSVYFLNFYNLMITQETGKINIFIVSIL